MLRQYTNELKKYNFLQRITQGYYLDAKDEGRWKVGQVQELRKVGHKWTIRVMFDGYNSRYNQDYDLPSHSKLAPFRRVTLPYTGPSNQQPRRQEPSKTLQHYIKVMSKCQKQLQSLQSQYINQFFRGQLFIYIDYWLTTLSTIKQQQLTKYLFQDYMRLFMTYLQLFDRILEKTIDFLQENEKQCSLDQNYIYVHPKMALLYSITEFVFNCNSMVSRKQERVSFHKVVARQQQQSEDNIYSIFLEKIGQLKIYDKCMRLLNFKSLSGTKSLPWSIKKQLTILLKSINPQYTLKLPKQTKQVIQLLQYLPYLTKKSVVSSDDQQKYRNQLIFHLILNGNFEGKLIGLNEIKRIINSYYYRSSKEAVLVEQIRERNLVGFFLDNNNFNSQLFKRALVIFEYAYKYKLFAKDHFLSVLKLHKDKHELQLKNFYNSLAEFGQFMSESDAIECFKMMIRELPFEQNFIELVKNYTIATVEKNLHFRKCYMQRDQQGLGLTYFWDLITSPPPTLTKQLINKVIQCFAKLLNNVFYSRQTQKIIVSSIKAIKQMKNPESFLKVIHESLKMCKGQRMNRAIQTAEREVNVVEVAMAMLRQQQGNLSRDGFENLFQFLQEVSSISRRGLTQSDILFLWRMDKPKCRSHLLRFLRKHKLRQKQNQSQQRIISKSLDPLLIQFFIKNIAQSPQMMQHYKQIDQQHYQTIDQLIMCYLHGRKIIDYNYKHTIRFRKNQYFTDQSKMFLGMEFYLKCIENNSDRYAEVTVKAIKRLIQIFLKPFTPEFSKSSTQYKVKNWLRVSKAFDGLRNNRLKCFQIQLTQIYGRMKSLNILEQDIIELKTKQASSGRTQTFYLPRCTSLWKLRLLIDERFQLDQSNFEIQLVENQTRTTLEREQDLSIAFIFTAKQKNGVSIIVHPSKEKHPHFVAIDRFKEELCEMIGEGLYKNLASSNQQKATQSLQILYKLPSIRNLQKSIQSFDFKSWSDVIDTQNMKRIQYQLKVIRGVKDLKWIQTFINKNGLKHLADVIFSNLGKDMNNYKTLNLLMVFFIEACKFPRTISAFDQKWLKDILYYQKQYQNFPKQTQQEYISFLLNCFTLIKDASSKIKLPTLFEKDKILQIFELVLFSTKKSNVSSQLIEICKANNSFSSLIKNLSFFVNYDYLTKKEFECKSFFEVIRLLIEKGETQLIKDSIENLLIKIRYSDIKQKSQNEPNELLYGYLLCVYELVKNSINSEYVLKQSKKGFYSYLLNECLFHSENISHRKFKSKQLRELGFKLLEILQLQNKKDSQIGNLLTPMMAKGAWRKQFDWAVQPVQIVTKKFTGLKNLAATCYMNSLLQQLFYIKNFSSQLMNVDPDLIDDKQNIVRQIQNIFGYLKYSVNPSYTTSSLCQNFILDGQPIDPRVQTDVDEFFHALMDKLQRNLQKINKKDIINEVFRGEFSNLIIGQECPHASERIEQFLSIRLQIKDKKTIHQALDEFIKGEILQGDNSYFCQRCDKKVKALKRVCIKDLPEIMIMTLKRFQFDYETMQKFKLNTYCSFPENINFLPYTKQGLQEDNDAKKEDYQYRLKGVVIHYGISQAGHYTSYVRTDEDGAWNYFDDEKITEFTLDGLEKQCFGGIEENPFGDDQQKKKNAYLLIYQKVKPPTQRLPPIPQSTLAHSKVHNLVQQDNTKTKVVNLLFQPNIQNYIYNLPQLNYKTYLIYFHTVFLRNMRRKDKYVEFYNKSVEILTKKGNAEWYLKQVNEAFMMEFVLQADYDVRFVVCSLICHAMRSVVDLEFMTQCVGMLNLKSILPFVKIFSTASQLQPQYAKYLAAINFSQVVLNLMRGKQIKQNNVIRKCAIRKQVTEFGVPASGFVERRLNDSICLLQAIEGCKTGMGLEEIKDIAMKLRNKRLLKSLALITVKKYRDLEQVKKLSDQWIGKQFYIFDPKFGEQNFWLVLIQIVEEFCKIQDKDQEKRVIILARIYIEAMKEAIVGFKSELLLFNGFFKMSLTNPVFRSIASAILNQKENKKLITYFKQWLKDLPNVFQNIRNEKLGWWKRPKKQYIVMMKKDIDYEVKPNIKDALSLLNSIIQKHPIDIVSDSLQEGDVGIVEQKNGPEIVQVTRKMGFLIEIKDSQGIHRWVNEDDVTKKFI